MFETRRRAPLRLAVAEGRVGCPRGHDVDLDDCLACGYLDDLPTRPAGEVRCSWRRSWSRIAPATDVTFSGQP